MIALTGDDEKDLREFAAALEIQPPLVNLVRQAVREFLVKRAARYFRRRCRPFVIIP